MTTWKFWSFSGVVSKRSPLLRERLPSTNPLPYRTCYPNRFSFSLSFPQYSPAVQSRCCLNTRTDSLVCCRLSENSVDCLTSLLYDDSDKFAFTLLRMGKPEFHAEWLRDEPCDATATGSRSYIPTARCQLPPGNGEHEIRMRAFGIPITSFLFPGKEAFQF